MFPNHLHEKLDSIPVGCVLPASDSGGGFPRDPRDKDPPTGQIPSWTETPLQGTSNQGQRTPLPPPPQKETWDQAARQEETSYRDNRPPAPMDRMTDASENITLPKLLLRAVTIYVRK